MDFEKTLKRLDPTLRRIVWRVKGSGSGFDADDLYQEALVHLWQACGCGVLEDKTDSYILQGCYFHLKNFLRTHAEKLRLVRGMGVSCDADGADVVSAVPDPVDVREEVHCSALIERVRNNGLTSREKEVFNFCLQGMTTRQIGARMGISHVRVVKLAQAMRRKCRAHLDA